MRILECPLIHSLQMRLEEWRATCGLKKATKHFVVCELHFSEDCFNPQSVQGSKSQLRRTAVLNQHLILIKPDENAGNAQKKRGVLMGIPAPGQIPDSVAVEGLK